MSLAEALAASGAVAGELDGVAVPLRFSSLEAEVAALRTSAGLSALPHLTVLRIAGAEAFRAFEAICPARLPTPGGALCQTLLLDEEARPFVDVHVGNDDDALWLIAEGAAPGALEAYLRTYLPPRARMNVDVELEDLGPSHVLLSLNGPFAWEVLVELEGLEILALPPLAFYRPTERRAYFRTGRTGEYGYDILVPREQADRYWERFLDAGRAFDVLPVGQEALGHAGLEDARFAIHEEGRVGLSPLELGLSARVAWEKPSFVGREALLARRAAGAPQKVVGLRGAAPFARGDAVSLGERGRLGERDGGRVLRAARSATLGEFIGLGLLEQGASARDGEACTVEHAGEASPARIVLGAFVENRSLAVDPNRDSYHDRGR